MMAGKSDLRLVGTTQTTGGKYRRIQIVGENELNGDTWCDTMRCVGTMEIKGNLFALSYKLTGDCKGTGNIEVDALSATGKIEALNIRGNRLSISGHLAATGNCEAELLELRGLVEVEGLLSAETVNIGMFGPCRAREIGGGTVTIKRSRFSRLKNLFTFQEGGSFRVDTIEGDTLFLEHVHADVVRGTNVTLGPGCIVGRVEYRHSLNKHAKASVKAENQI
jgi:cytoskeletal protein CcmA (bactofilin family)